MPPGLLKGDGRAFLGREGKLAAIRERRPYARGRAADEGEFAQGDMPIL